MSSYQNRTKRQTVLLSVLSRLSCSHTFSSPEWKERRMSLSWTLSQPRHPATFPGVDSQEEYEVHRGTKKSSERFMLFFFKSHLRCPITQGLRDELCIWEEHFAGKRLWPGLRDLGSATGFAITDSLGLSFFTCRVRNWTRSPQGLSIMT